MSKKYQYLAGLQKSTGEIVYSRARHDCRSTTDGDAFIDGGDAYFRSGWTREPLEQIVIELSVSPALIYDDWNNKIDKCGSIKPFAVNDATNEFCYPSTVKIIRDETKHEDRHSFAFKRKMATWKTYSKSGIEPGRTIMLEDAETDHLEAILTTQTHISAEMREIVEDILKEREN